MKAKILSETAHVKTCFVKLDLPISVWQTLKDVYDESSLDRTVESMVWDWLIESADREYSHYALRVAIDCGVEPQIYRCPLCSTPQAAALDWSAEKDEAGYYQYATMTCGECRERLVASEWYADEQLLHFFPHTERPVPMDSQTSV